jgi:hypothetical protein
MPARTALDGGRLWVGSRLATEILGAASDSALARPQATDQGGGLIYLADAASIAMAKGCSVTNLVLIRYQTKIPADATEVATWTGDGIVSSADSQHNMHIEKVAIFGFAQAIRFPDVDDGDPWTGQIHISDVILDNKAGIYINGSLDVCRITNVHAWPFASVNLAGVADADKQRAGSAFKIDDSSDWTKFTNCFSYGYIYGWRIIAANNVSLLNCGADYTATMTGQPIGVKIEGSSSDTNIIGFQGAGLYFGINISTTAAAGSVQVTGSQFWDLDASAILLDDGALSVVGNKFWNLPQAIGINGANAGKVVVSGNIFHTITTAVYGAHASQDQSNWAIGDDNVYISVTAIAGAGFDIPSFTDTDATPDVTGVKKWKTGNTGGAIDVTDFDGQLYAGQELIIVGADGGNSTLKHNAAFMNLSGASDFAPPNDSVIHLVYDGTDWNEISRSTNST